ncbi:MAG TPA: hypothetical protein VF212_01560 [Longimicrobiales bacterium]
MTRHVTASLLLLLALARTDARAQGYGPCLAIYRCPPPAEAPDDRPDARYAAINAALGALTTGIASLVRGRLPDVETVLTGAIGGAIIYGGKRLVAEPGDGNGLLGREVAAFGGSLVRNAAAGRPALSSLTFPVGPLRFEIEPGESGRVQVNLAAVIAAGYFLFERDGAAVDLGATLSTGALVLVGRGDRPGGMGRHVAGVVWLAGPQAFDAPVVLRHELVHVLQSDQAFALVGDPLERWLAASHPAIERVGRHVDFGLESLLTMTMNGLVPYYDRPWEIEAYRITGEPD